MTKDPSIESFLEMVSSTLATSRSLARKSNTCVSCGGEATAFRGELDRREYNISLLCQRCQDRCFAELKK